MPRHTIAGQMLESTADLVDGDRNRTHGTKLKNFQNIAAIWSAYLTNVGGLPVTASQCADMMELLKVARRQHGAHNPDDYVDGAGYAAVALEVKEGEIEADKEAARRDLESAGIGEEALGRHNSGPSNGKNRSGQISADLTKAVDDELTTTFGPIEGVEEMAKKLAPKKT